MIIMQDGGRNKRRIKSGSRQLKQQQQFCGDSSASSFLQAQQSEQPAAAAVVWRQWPKKSSYSRQSGVGGNRSNRGQNSELNHDSTSSRTSHHVRLLGRVEIIYCQMLAATSTSSALNPKP